MQYRRELDGLRALAVLPVVLFHAQLPFFDGGFVGVDIFFVISGYLITSILLEQLDQGSFSLGQFYERRARRILPAFVVMMLVCLPLSQILMDPHTFQEFLDSFLQSAIGLSNLYFMDQVGYFAPDADLQPLLHTWSLGVEEQYYFAFPLLLAGLTALKPSLRTQGIIGLTVAGFVFAEVARHIDPERSFFFTLSRTWELGLGSVCAALVRKREFRASNLYSLTGLALIAFSLIVYDRTVPFPSVYTLPPLIGTCLIILFAQEKTLVGRLLSAPPFVGLGLISYSVYLWHQPIFSFARLLSAEHPSSLQMAGLSALTILVGWISWRCIEQPFRQPQHTLLAGRRQMLGASAAAIVTLLGLAGLGIAFEDYSRATWLRLNPDIAGPYLLLEQAQLERNLRAGAMGDPNPTECRFRAPNLDEAVAKRLDDCHRKYGPGIMVLGDSHAIDFFGVVISRFASPFVVGMTQDGCRPHDPESDCQFDQVADYLSQRNGQPIKRVVYTQAGFYLMQTADGSPVRRSFFDKLTINTPLPRTLPDAGRIDATVAYLNRLSRFTQVKWVGPRTEPHIPFKHFARVGCDARFTLRPGQGEAFEALDAFIGSRVAKFGQFSYVSQNQMMRFDWATDYSDCKELFFADGDHYSAAGEIRFGRDLPPSFLN
ncbi:acyltransferase family protein [Rhizobium sp. G187]|uniref:acyltransferase family protein n=1 Tax=Rhizobium sp. G187 TaxID=3451352 RepID=UPI003EE6BA4B